MLNLLSRRSREERHEDQTRAEIRAAIAEEFDAEFYLGTYADVAQSGADALDHYIRYGAREGRDPSARFSTRHYLSVNPDVRESGMNPLHHYVTHGRAEGRMPVIEAEGIQVEAWIEDLEPLIAEIEADFDAGFYRQHNPGIEGDDAELIRHYLTAGARAGRDPAPWFSTVYYTATHADVRRVGLNPLVHYVRNGRAEGRLTRPPGGFRAAALRGLEPLETQAARWRRDLSGLEPLSPEALARALWREGDIAPWMVLAVSHDDYTENTGGIQLAIQTEAQTFAQARVDYIHLYPAQPLPMLAPAEGVDRQIVHIRRNGHLIGAARVSTVALVVERLAHKDIRFDLVVHALHGHAPEAIEMIADAARPKNAFFWVHDHLSICAGHTLLRNTVQFCGAPPPDSAACGVCVFGAGRRAHLARMTALFEAVPFTVIAPSKAARDLWRRSTALAHRRLIVHSHCTLAARAEPGGAPADEDRPLRIGFAGMAGMHKGWPAFLDLVGALGHRKDLEFHTFGITAPDDPRLIHHPVAVTRADRSAMIDALHEAGIDIAFLWSLCPETFSYAAHEALAAGCLILTHRDSGNIARLTRDEDAGWVFDDEAAALALLASGDWRPRVAARRATAEAAPRLTAHSNLTADFLLRGAGS